VPLLVGQNKSEAADILESADLVEGDTEAVVSEADLDIIVSQNPVAGTVVPAGSEVNYDYSKGLQVPDVVGMTQANAETAITTAGFTVGTETEQYDPEVPSGSVISQSPAGETFAEAGSAIDLVISKGEEPI
jgi:beta-lactam-binding protein with PASTA domain